MRKQKETPEQRAKAALISHLLKIGVVKNDVVIINELALESFSRRADLVLVNGSIELFEIKSEADTLHRLSGQIDVFSKFCDKLHVVCAPCHVNNVLAQTADNIAVWQVEAEGYVKVIRRGKKDKLSDRKVLLKLINAKELRQLVSTNNMKPTSYRRKHMEESALALPKDQIRDYVLSALKQRYTNTTKEFLDLTVSEEGVDPRHLVALRRKKAHQLLQQRMSSDNTTQTTHDDVHLWELASQADDDIFGTPPEEIKKLLN